MSMEIITSKTNSKIKNLIKLKSQKEKDAQKLFLSSDLKVIKIASELNLLEAIYSVKKLNYKNNFVVSKDVMSKLSKEEVIGVIKYLPSNKINSNKIIYLDRISDPSNLGKIILLAVKYNYKNIILSKECTSVYNEKCLEIAKENIFKVNFIYGDISTLKHLKSDGYQIAATGLKSSTLLSNVKLKNKYVIIFGNEAKGVSEDILSMSDVVIRIPIKNIDSLNVSVATSITLDNI